MDDQNKIIQESWLALPVPGSVQCCAMQDAHFTFDSASQPWAAKYVTQLGLSYDLHQNIGFVENQYKLLPNAGKCSTSKVAYAKALAACSIPRDACCVCYSDIIKVSTHAAVAPLILCCLLHRRAEAGAHLGSLHCLYMSIRVQRWNSSS